LKPRPAAFVRRDGYAEREMRIIKEKDVDISVYDVLADA